MKCLKTVNICRVLASARQSIPVACDSNIKKVPSHFTATGLVSESKRIRCPRRSLGYLAPHSEQGRWVNGLLVIQVFPHLNHIPALASLLQRGEFYLSQLSLVISANKACSHSQDTSLHSLQ